VVREELNKLGSKPRRRSTCKPLDIIDFAEKAEYLL